MGFGLTGWATGARFEGEIGFVSVRFWVWGVVAYVLVNKKVRAVFCVAGRGFWAEIGFVWVRFVSRDQVSIFCLSP